MDALSQCGADAWHGDQFRDGGVLDAFSSPEVAEKGLQFLGAEPFHTLKRVGQPCSAASLAVKRVDEAVRFVPGVTSTRPARSSTSGSWP